jgi:nitrate/nitrite-specific signal transduction histidine kinase
MRERAEAFDGSFRVNSVPGQGTVVELTIPFKSDGQHQAQEKKDS